MVEEYLSKKFDEVQAELTQLITEIAALTAIMEQVKTGLINVGVGVDSTDALVPAVYLLLSRGTILARQLDAKILLRNETYFTLIMIQKLRAVPKYTQQAVKEIIDGVLRNA